MKHHTWLHPDYRNFLLVVEFGSLSATARKSGLDLGNLSRSISRVEKLQGSPLFTRLSTGLKLTITGAKLFEALSNSSQAYGETFAIPGTQKILIGFSPPVGFGFFGEHFFPYLVELGLTAEFRMAPSLELYESLKAREIDLVLSPRSPKFPGIISRSLFSTQLTLCSRTGKNAPHLIRSSQIFDLEKRLTGLNVDSTVVIDDYFVAAKFLEHSDDHMGIVPECILSHFPKLKVLPHKFSEDPVCALTWKGSPGLTLLKFVGEKLKARA